MNDTAAGPTATELAGLLEEAVERWPEAFGPRALDAVLDVRFVLLGVDNRNSETTEEQQ
jgi:hypothetical protein